jgi:hypothetical protein
MPNNHPKNECVCTKDKHWIGRNLLRNAMLAHEGRPRSYPSAKKKSDIPAPDERPLFWMIESPETFRRPAFTTDVAERAAKPVRSFLKANNIDVTNENVSLKSEWRKNKLVRVFTGAASEPATIAMHPNMSEKIWGLVRFDNEPTSYSKALKRAPKAPNLLRD